ncbi:hypothetical protein KR100_06955 [Synechococcus sp. KORDI-100]|nr:hypothetical protein KR100_06955 [Synechococcus sp. KORDI-100]
MGHLVAAMAAAPLLTMVVAAVHAGEQLQLTPRQTILEADRHLLADGWIPAPQQTPSVQERQWASVSLPSLSSCAGTGVGYCRFDYQRNQQRLSVVTVPSEPGRPSVGRVDRWW